METIGTLEGPPGIRRTLTWRGLPVSGVRMLKGLNGSAEGEKAGTGLGAVRLGAVVLYVASTCSCGGFGGPA